MRIGALWAVLAVPGLAAVDGIVTNETTGRPQSNATVTLYKFGASGPEPLDSVKSGADGRWRIDKPFEGMGFIQTAYAGVTYNHTLRQGTPLTGIPLAVFEISKKRGDAIDATNHMLLLEPQGDKLLVRESYFFVNSGKTTWNDPANGTLRFVVAGEPVGQVEVNATAPQGMAIRRAPEKGRSPGEMKLDFPIKPGETRIDIAYTLPYQSPARFQTRFLIPAQQTMIAVPSGVELKGEGIVDEGKEPTTQASVFRSEKNVLDLTLTGTGDLTGAGGEDAPRGPPVEQIYARPYDKLPIILTLVFCILGLGFAILYRRNSLPSKDSS